MELLFSFIATLKPYIQQFKVLYYNRQIDDTCAVLVILRWQNLVFMSWMTLQRNFRNDKEKGPNDKNIRSNFICFIHFLKCKMEHFKPNFMNLVPRFFEIAWNACTRFISVDTERFCHVCGADFMYNIEFSCFFHHLSKTSKMALLRTTADSLVKY